MSDYIPEDNLFFILKYLPVKTLLRFRCVCKDWKQFIDSPTFSQLHLSVQKPRFIVELHEPYYVVVDPQPDPLVYNLSKPAGWETSRLLIGTLHGVVCLYHLYNLVLWNPSLRRFLSRHFPYSFKWCTFNQDPVLNSYGFWIDPTTKEFKAIILQQGSVVQCIMYSSIRDDWTEIPTRKILKWNRCREGPPVIVEGVAHWGGCLLLDESIVEGDAPWGGSLLLDEFITDSHGYHPYHHLHKDNAILSFDFMQESFDIIEMPDLHSRDYSPCRWQGTLSVMLWDYDLPCGCEIYSRQEDSWVKMVGFKVDIDPCLRVFWVMEDMEARKKKRNRKKDVELERLCDLSIGETQENVKVLATTTSDRVKGELILHGTKTGRKALMKELWYYDDVVMAYDFVESLLFP